MIIRVRRHLFVALTVALLLCYYKTLYSMLKCPGETTCGLSTKQKCNLEAVKSLHNIIGKLRGSFLRRKTGYLF